MRRKKLADFIPVYSDDRTGRIVIDEENEMPMKAVEHLPELKGGEMLVSPQGNKYIVHRVSKPRRLIKFDEPVYKLERTIVCNGEYLLDELNELGYKLEGEKVHD